MQLIWTWNTPWYAKHQHCISIWQLQHKTLGTHCIHSLWHAYSWNTMTYNIQTSTMKLKYLHLCCGTIMFRIYWTHQNWWFHSMHNYNTECITYFNLTSLPTIQYFLYYFIFNHIWWFIILYAHTDNYHKPGYWVTILSLADRIVVCIISYVYNWFTLSSHRRIEYANIGQLSVKSIPYGLISTQKRTLSCGYISTEIAHITCICYLLNTSLVYIFACMSCSMNRAYGAWNMAY